MKKPESPPNRKIQNNKDKDSFFSLLKNPQLLDEIYSIEKDYPYWGIQAKS